MSIFTDRNISIANLCFGAVIGAGVSLTGVMFDVINVETEKNRFSLEFFDKYQRVMEQEDLSLRAEWLQRLKRAHEDEPLVIISAALELTESEIAEREELARAEKLKQEAEAAERRVVAAKEQEARAQAEAAKAAAEAARLAAEEDAKQKAIAAEKAAKAAAEASRLIQRDSLYLGYSPTGRRYLIP